MADIRETHLINMFKGPNIPESQGITEVVTVGRYLADPETRKYINKWWFDDDKRIRPLPKGDELKENPINLNEGFDKSKWDVIKDRDDVLKTDLKMFHNLLEWIYIKAYDLAAENVRVVANGPTLYDLLQAPYERVNPDGNGSSGCTIFVSKFKGILYMFRFYEADAEVDESFRLVKYRGKKFRSSMTTNTSGDEGEKDFKRRVVNKASFRGFDMLYTTKVSSIDSKGRFVSLHIMPEDNVEKFSFYRKLLRHWSIAIFSPAPKMLIGLRQRHETENDPTSEVLVTGFKTMATASIPQQVKDNTPEGKRIAWEPRICFKNLENVIDTLMVLLEDDPRVVYRLGSGKPNQHGYIDHLLLRKMTPETAVEVIPEWYID